MEHIIDLGTVFSADDLFDLLEEHMDFPAYFGRNLDAFYDVLTEVSSKRPLELHFTNFAEGEAVLGKFMRNFRKACERAQGENHALTFTFE